MTAGGISFLTEGAGRGAEDGSVTDPALGPGVGVTAEVRPNVGIRFDVRDVAQFCEGGSSPQEFRGENPCLDDGPTHHPTLQAGIEAAF